MSLRQLSIQWKITLLAGLCLLGIVTLLVGLSLYRMEQSSQQVKASSMLMLDEAAQSRIEAQGEVQALGIRRQFMDAYQYGHGFSRQVLFLREQAEKRFLDAFDTREDLANLDNMTLTNSTGTSVPLAQVGHFQAVMEEPILKRRNRATTVEVRADIIDGVQPPDVEMAVYKDLQPLIAKLPAGYHIDIGGPVEESAKANVALAALFPIMILLTLTVIMFQVRSFGVMFMVFATAPLGLIGAVPTLLLFNQPFGFNAILGLIGIGGILMRNTLIFTDQIRQNQDHGMPIREAIIEATVRRARPVILTALAAALAFIPLTLSVFWSSLAYVLIGGVLVGTVLTLLFLPALCSLVLRDKVAETSHATAG